MSTESFMGWRRIVALAVLAMSLAYAAAGAQTTADPHAVHPPNKTNSTAAAGTTAAQDSSSMGGMPMEPAPSADAPMGDDDHADQAANMAAPQPAVCPVCAERYGHGVPALLHLLPGEEEVEVNGVVDGEGMNRGGAVGHAGDVVVSTLVHLGVVIAHAPFLIGHSGLDALLYVLFSKRIKLEGAAPRGASSVGPWIAQACNCDRRGCIWVS